MASTTSTTEPEPAESLESFTARLATQHLAGALGLIAHRLAYGTRRGAALPEELKDLPKAALKKMADVLDLYADQLPPDRAVTTPEGGASATEAPSTPTEHEHTDPAAYIADPDPGAMYIIPTATQTTVIHPDGSMTRTGPAGVEVQGYASSGGMLDTSRPPMTMVEYGPVLWPPHPEWRVLSVGQPGPVSDATLYLGIESPETVARPFSTRRAAPVAPDLSSVNLDALTLTWPEHDSWSAVETFVQCGFKYLAQYGYGLKRVGPPAWWLLAGTASHRVIEGWERVLVREGAAPGPDDTAKLFAEIFAEQIQQAVESDTDPYADRGTWLAADGGREDRAWWEDHGPGYIASYVTARTTGPERAWKLATTGDRLAIEIGGTAPVRIAPDVDRPIQLWADLVLTDGQRLRIRDMKFGKSGPTPGAAQLDFYRFGLGILMPELVPGDAGLPGGGWEGDYWLGRKGIASEPKPLTFERSAGVVRRHVAALDSARKAHVFLPNPGNFCGSCAVRSLCPAFTPDGKSPLDNG